MTTLREAAQMALKALEYYKHRNLEWDYADEHAIESLSAALAQPIKPDYSKAGFGQPEQERDTGGACVVVNGTSGVFTVPLPGKPGGGGISPAQQREWVGLTDEEIDAAVKSCNTVDTYKYFRAIEAKLKEKNT